MLRTAVGWAVDWALGWPLGAVAATGVFSGEDRGLAGMLAGMLVGATLEETLGTDCADVPETIATPGATLESALDRGFGALSASALGASAAWLRIPIPAAPAIARVLTVLEKAPESAKEERKKIFRGEGVPLDMVCSQRQEWKKISMSIPSETLLLL